MTDLERSIREGAAEAVWERLLSTAPGIVQDTWEDGEAQSWTGPEVMLTCKAVYQQVCAALQVIPREEQP